MLGRARKGSVRKWEIITESPVLITGFEASEAKQIWQWHPINSPSSLQVGRFQSAKTACIDIKDKLDGRELKAGLAPVQRPFRHFQLNKIYLNKCVFLHINGKMLEIVLQLLEFTFWMASIATRKFLFSSLKRTDVRKEIPGEVAKHKERPQNVRNWTRRSKVEDWRNPTSVTSIQRSWKTKNCTEKWC